LMLERKWVIRATAGFILDRIDGLILDTSVNFFGDAAGVVVTG
jgi:hypothetical protein